MIPPRPIMTPLGGTTPNLPQNMMGSAMPMASGAKGGGNAMPQTDFATMLSQMMGRK